MVYLLNLIVVYEIMVGKRKKNALPNKEEYRVDEQGIGCNDNAQVYLSGEGVKALRKL